MKYKKGEFNVIPNKSYLNGKPSELQAIYFWIVDHADEEGICFPNRTTLANEAGCNIKTVDKYIKVLVADNVLTKTNRRDGNSQKMSSNLYQIRVVDSTENGSLPSTKNGSETIPILTTTHISGLVAKSNDTTVKEIELPFTFEVALEKLGNSTWVVDKIIHNYWVKKGFRFENQKQFNAARSRELRPAKLLEGYSATQINKAMDYCQEKFNEYGWTLETVNKRIAEIINRK